VGKKLEKGQIAKKLDTCIAMVDAAMMQQSEQTNYSAQGKYLVV
jgi:hypothetical protein